MIKEGNTSTFKCPTCGTKVLTNTGYCLKCKKKVQPKGGKRKPKEKKETLLTALSIEECMDQFAKEYNLDQWSVDAEMSYEDMLASAVYPSEDGDFGLEIEEGENAVSLIAVQKMNERLDSSAMENTIAQMIRALLSDSTLDVDDIGYLIGKRISSSIQSLETAGFFESHHSKTLAENICSSLQEDFVF